MPALEVVDVRTCLGNFVALRRTCDDDVRIAEFGNAAGADSLAVDLSESAVFKMGHDLRSQDVVLGDELAWEYQEPQDA
ncbi:hypothetical protein ALP03_200264 [Pseudomonas amygdali pv. tabaci]|uniref:Uncharacterized protein n=1 Tax=Pseudomonas amygdali pv. tabaci TaxID=322 RepID=A0A3M6HBP4_PSEAJ|nr:hypothetical protein ALP03_200264 [Pseudomonas amygdali pv. tabaci]